jgi:hypothetical protein
VVGRLCKLYLDQDDPPPPSLVRCSKGRAWSMAHRLSQNVVRRRRKSVPPCLSVSLYSCLLVCLALVGCLVGRTCFSRHREKTSFHEGGLVLGFFDRPAPKPRRAGVNCH